MYRIIEVNESMRAYICMDNKPSKYGTPKQFKRLKDAKAWISRHSYGGMSFSYEIEKVD